MFTFSHRKSRAVQQSAVEAYPVTSSLQVAMKSLLGLAKIHQRARNALPHLPNEIWIHITGFLEKEDLAKVFSLSPVLLDFWMRTVYAEVKVCTMNSPLHILHSMTALAATYVSKLLICPRFFEGFDTLPLALPSPSAEKTRQSTIATLRMKSWTGHPKSIQINVQALFEKITQMVNLKTIVVDCIHGRQSWKYFRQADAFINTARTFSIRLEHLELHLPLGCLEGTLFTDQSMSRLQSLSISVWLAPEYITSTESQLARLFQFINIHATSLQRLSLDNVDSCINITTILPSLVHIPNLREVHVGLHNNSATDARAQVERFLCPYAEQLEKLDILVYGRVSFNNSLPNFFEYDLIKVKFPLLKSLQSVLKDPRYLPSTTTYFTPPAPAAASRFLTQQRSTLQSLVLKSRQVSADEIQLVGTALGGETSKLLSLGIQMEVFDPELLAILALNLPNLLELDIGNTNLRDTSFHLTMNEKRQSFLNTMSDSHPALDAWRLRNFKFHILYDVESWVHIRQAVLRKLPNVITFNGYTRDEAMSASAISPRNP